MESGIYMIRNTITDCKYIGQTNNFKRRFMEHRRTLRRGTAFNTHLQRSWDKHGESVFEFSIVERCSVEMLDEREQYWIKFYDSHANGYNQNDGGSGSRGWVPTDEWREKLSAANKHPKEPSAIEATRKGLKKYYSEHESASNIAVVCLNTGEVFLSGTKAAQRYGIASGSQVFRCCYGELRSSGRDEDGNKLVWRTQEQYETMTEDDIQQCIAYAYEPSKLPADFGERISKSLSGNIHSAEHCANSSAAIKKWYETHDSQSNIAVVCLNDGITYASAVKAGEACGVRPGSIRRCCNGELHSTVSSKSETRLVWMDKDQYDTLTSDEVAAHLNAGLNAQRHMNDATKKKVLCVDTGVVYESLIMAASETHTNINSISACCRGKQNIANGMHWEYWTESSAPIVA